MERKKIFKILIPIFIFLVLLATFLFFFVLRDTPEGTNVGKQCGGIMNISCPMGFYCDLDGDYPDASGVCRIGLN
jgi:hypothetical protein